MRIQWFPVFVGVIIGGFGSASMYPLCCRAVGVPMTGILGLVGAVSIGIAGASICGFGAAVPCTVWCRWFRDPQCVGVSAIMLVLLLLCIPSWCSEPLELDTFELPYVIGSMVVGVLIRCSFEGLVWLYRRCPRKH